MGSELAALPTMLAWWHGTCSITERTQSPRDLAASASLLTIHEIRDTAHHAWHLCGLRRSNSGPDLCKAGTVADEPPP